MAALNKAVMLCLFHAFFIPLTGAGPPHMLARPRLGTREEKPPTQSMNLNR
jgi:hypothetical protein